MKTLTQNLLDRLAEDLFPLLPNSLKVSTEERTAEVMKTTKEVCDAIEMDVKFPRRVGCREVDKNFAVATYEGLPAVLERHIDPLVKRIAVLEEAIKSHRSQKIAKDNAALRAKKA